MSNTLTNVAPTLYSAAREVPRELTGFLGAVNVDFDDKGVAKGDTVNIGVVPSMSTASVTPSQTFTAGTDRVFTKSTLTLNQFKEVSWNLTAENERSLMNSGVAQDLLKQTVQQAFRALINGIETYIGGIAYKAASRAVGTAGTTPFGSDFALTADLRRILDDNGAAATDRTIVINTAAGANLRKNGVYKVNEAGSDQPLRAGVLLDLNGFAIRESAGVAAAVTAGTGTSYVSNGGNAVGDTSLMIKTGSGTVLAGDVVTFTGDTNKYVVTTGVAAPGTIVIAEPGLKVAVTDGQAMTIGSAATQNVALRRSGVAAVVRPALQPEGGGTEQMVLADPVSKFSALLLRVPGNAMSSWYLRAVYDAFAPNPYEIANLLG